MGNALAREVIPNKNHPLASVLGVDMANKGMNTLLAMLAVVRKRTKCVSMNPDAKAVMDSTSLMQELNIRGPHIESSTASQVVDVGLDTLMYACLAEDHTDLLDAIRFYVPDPWSEITSKSRIHFVVPAIDDNVTGFVLFFDKRAAEFAKLYIATFCPDVQFAKDGRLFPDLDSLQVPPLSDLLGFTRCGPPKLKNVFGLMKDSFALQALRTAPAVESTKHNSNVVRQMCEYYSMKSYENVPLNTSLSSIAPAELVRLAIENTLEEQVESSQWLPDSQEADRRLVHLIYDSMKNDEVKNEKIGFVFCNRIIELAIYRNAKNRACIDGPVLVCVAICLFMDLTFTTIRARMAKHFERATIRLRREQKEAQQRIDRVISRCVSAAIASMKLKHITERREQLDERRRRAELEEEAARQAKLKAERLARAAAPPKRTPKAPAQTRRAARAARLPPPAVEAKLKSARQEAAKDHEKYLKDREAERVAELEELAEKVRIGTRIAHGD